jgi:hypothetical protein
MQLPYLDEPMRAVPGSPEMLIPQASGTASRSWYSALSAVGVGQLLAALVCFSGLVGIHSADGAERLRMIGPPPAEETVRDLMESVASSCNRRLFTEFMSHFTPRQAAAIRSRMETCFVQTDIVMEIQDAIVLSHNDERIIFGVRYAWNETPGQKRLFASKVTAVKVGGSWKIDREQVQSQREEAHVTATAAAHRFDFGGGGVVALNPNDDFLPLDIPRRPGRCVNGRCGL